MAAPPSHPIHLFRPAYRVEETLAEIRECLEKGWTGLGYKTGEFEEAWKAYTRLPHAHFVNSATAGLHLAVKLFKEDGGWQEGDEVITTPLTFVSTNHVILYERLQPVFADVDEHLCLDPASVAARITPRTRAVCFVGVGGSIGRYREVLEICRARGLILILDAAHMAGTWITREHGHEHLGSDHAGSDHHAGHDADAAVFSFHAVKNLPMADGGAVCFAREDLDREVRTWSWLGIDRDTYTRTLGAGPYRWHYNVEHVGFKYHGNSMMAALGLVGLKYLEEDNQQRRQLAAWYDEALAGDKRIGLIPQPAGFRSSRHLYQVIVENRDEVMVGMNQRGVFPGVHYTDNTVYPMYRKQEGRCPRARWASDRIISLPMHLGLSRADVERVAQALAESVV
jgi:dTDP-4-amino-4,6-dideoxygalactose transaminase